MALKTHHFLILILNALSVTSDFCNGKICPHQGTHVRCGKDGSFGKACKGDYKVINMEPYQTHILHQHNYYRNLVASGQLDCFKPAVRMAQLDWNEDLAENAKYNVLTCVFEHDECRSTKDFPYAGQNIYFLNTTRENLAYKDLISEAIFLWFNEQKDCNYTILERFSKTTPQTGHFCMMVNDRHTAVGCAMSLQLFIPFAKKLARTIIIITCNYSSTNISKRPSYKPGPSGSECTEISKDYKALCANSINPNDIDWYFRD